MSQRSSDRSVSHRSRKKSQSDQLPNFLKFLKSLPSSIQIDSKLLTLENDDVHNVLVSILRELSRSYQSNSVQEVSISCEAGSLIKSIDLLSLRKFLMDNLGKTSCDLIVSTKPQQLNEMIFGFQKEVWEKLLKNQSFRVKAELFTQYYGTASFVRRSRINKDELFYLLIDIASLGQGDVLNIRLTINEAKGEMITRDLLLFSINQLSEKFKDLIESYRPFSYRSKDQWRQDSDNFVGEGIPDISDISKMINPPWDLIGDPIELFGVQLQKRIDVSPFDLISILLQHHQGVIIGENHDYSLSRYLISKYFEKMTEENVTPVNIMYCEGLVYTIHQPYLDSYFLNDTEEEIPPLFMMAMHFSLDERFRKYSIIDILKAAKGTVINRKLSKKKSEKWDPEINNYVERMIGIELASRSNVNNMGYLVKMFDYGAINVIRSTVSDRKFIALVGDAHTAGLAARLQVPIITVRPGTCRCFEGYEEKGETLDSQITKKDFTIRSSSNNMIYAIEGPEPVRFYSSLKNTSRIAT